MKTARPYDELKVDRIPENRCGQIPIEGSGFLVCRFCENFKA
jgi:hypothetical protein